MEKVLLAAVFVCLSLHSSVGISTGAEKVFCVQPTVPTTECPMRDSPCHSLQYYANHSSFTNNSRFLFLEGEHNLMSMVAISNVANLSLVGASSGVKIVCKSLPTAFHMENFTHLTFDNIALSCGGGDDSTFYLMTGSEVYFNNLVISSGVGYAAQIIAVDVVGLFSVNNMTSNGRVEYSVGRCTRPSYYEFSNSTLIGFLENYLDVNCSDVYIHIADSYFSSLKINFDVLTSNSVLVNNSQFNGSITIDCWEDDLQCDNNSMKLTGVIVDRGEVQFRDLTGNCMFLIEDSMISPAAMGFSSIYESTSPAIFQRVTFRTVQVTIAVAMFINCTFENNIESAIYASNSRLIFEGNNIFRNNSALVGSGINLLWSFLHLRPNTTILFENNHATYVGGAMYIESEQCFLELDSQSVNNTIFNFINNTAGSAGSSVYGNSDLEVCCEEQSCIQFYSIFNISNSESDPSAIASAADAICFCEENKHRPNCSLPSVHYTRAFPGQVFPIRLAILGGSPFEGVVLESARAFFNSSTNATLGLYQSSQAASKASCENFNYSIHTAETGNVTFTITMDHTFLDALTGNVPLFSELSVNAFLMDCPLGFSNSGGGCECDPLLSKNGVQCNIIDQSFFPPNNSWVGFIGNSSSDETGVMFHSNCPTGYCLPHGIRFTSNSSNSQCEHHRTGLLCGACEEGYSLALGNGKCLKCSNTYLLLVLPLAVAGVFIVAILFALKLTVTEGSINGLIFYANVIGMNHAVLFSRNATGYSYLHMFLAWLNLDLGISTCLFDGLDGYTETWLQFIFPVYLWTIVLAIIWVYSKFPRMAMKLGGNNAVAVLSTLMLLSYTKLQRTVVTIMSFTEIVYPDGVVHYVWLYDANVEFFRGKHLYLGIAGILVLVFLIVPYTMCLAFFQQLQACSNRRLFSWVNKLKPVFDSYAGPYKDKYRFWTGMLLVTRTLLIILFTANTAGSVELNLLIISVVSSILLLANTSGVYKKWPYNYLESFFYLQLVVFAAGVAYAKLTHGDIAAVADTSFGLTISAFIAVLAHHFFRCVVSLWKWYYHLKGYDDVNEDDISINHDHSNLHQVY